jgi:hypothetical protein
MRALVALLILLPTLAAAADPNALAEKEARSFLRPCPAGPNQQLCLLHQRNFIEQYVYAKSGDDIAQRSTAESFDTNHLQTEEVLSGYIGMPQNQLQACAWWLVVAQSGKYTVDPGPIVRATCAKLSPTMQPLAMHRADELLHELRTTPAREPSDDWEPIVAGLKDP